MNILAIGSLYCGSHLEQKCIQPDDLLIGYQNKPLTKTSHFSYHKGHYIAKGFSELNHTVYLLYGELQRPVHDEMIYVPIEHITEQFLEQLDAIIFFKHNVGLIDEVIAKVPAIKNLVDQKLSNNTAIYKPYLVCKTCILPQIKYIGKNRIGQLFDFYFLQTNQVGLHHSVIRQLMSDQEYLQYKRKPQFETVREVQRYTQSNRIQYSEMFVDYNIQIPKHLTNLIKTIVYIGRIRQNHGMLCPFLILLMNKLGPEYKLVIYPGSFNLPNEKLKKYNPNKPAHLLKLREYFAGPVDFLDEYRLKQAHPEDYVKQPNHANIIVHEPIEYGQQYQYLAQADVAICFSPTRVPNKQCSVGCTKIFDYLASGLPVISEFGCQNNYMIHKYQAGKVIDHIGTIEDYYQAILQVCQTTYDREKISQKFTAQENYLVRSKHIINVFQQIE